MSRNNYIQVVNATGLYELVNKEAVRTLVY